MKLKKSSIALRTIKSTLDYKAIFFNSHDFAAPDILSHGSLGHAPAKRERAKHHAAFPHPERGGLLLITYYLITVTVH
jgi:hypothetical protein